MESQIKQSLSNLLNEYKEIKKQHIEELKTLDEDSDEFLVATIAINHITGFIKQLTDLIETGVTESMLVD